MKVISMVRNLLLGAAVCMAAPSLFAQSSGTTVAMPAPANAMPPSIHLQSAVDGKSIAVFQNDEAWAAAAAMHNGDHLCDAKGCVMQVCTGDTCAYYYCTVSKCARLNTSAAVLKPKKTIA